MVGAESENKNLKPGVWGVGSCDYSPGIVDAKYGKMLIAPGNYVARYFKGVIDIKSITPNQLRECVSSYYFTTT